MKMLLGVGRAEAVGRWELSLFWISQPVSPDRREDVEFERVLKGFRLMLYVGRDVQHLSLADDDLFIAHQEP